MEGVAREGLWRWLSRAWHSRLLPWLVRLDRAFPVAAKFMLPVVVLGSAAAVAVAWLDYNQERQRVEDDFVERGLILARSLQADGIQGHFPEHLDDPADLRSHIEKLMMLEPSLLRVNIYAQGVDGPRVVASSDSFQVGRPADAHDSLPLSTGSAITEERRLGEEKALEVLAPLQRDGKTVASVGLYMSLAGRDAAIRDGLLLTVTLAGSTVLVGVFLIWLTVRILILSRLHKLVQAGQRLTDGDFSARVAGGWSPPGRDEVAAAIHHFNQMAASLEKLTQELEELATTDHLTGLCNRRRFDEAVTAEVGRAQRMGYPLAFLMMDLDGFKALNDRFGHQMGDEVLRWVASLIKANVRPMDTVARYGGDEFAALLPGADAEEARAIGERLRQAVGTITFGPSGGGLGLSVGVAVLSGQAEGAEELVRRADEALLAAKEAGRNYVWTAGVAD